MDCQVSTVNTPNTVGANTQTSLSVLCIVQQSAYNSIKQGKSLFSLGALQVLSSKIILARNVDKFYMIRSLFLAVHSEVLVYRWKPQKLV